MNAKYNHINNVEDRLTIIALLEKEMELRALIENKETDARRDWKCLGSSEEERNALANLMTSINKIAAKYEHLLPEIIDPFADLYK